MSAARRPLMLAACFALGAMMGCAIGPSVERYAPAHSREGITVEVRTAERFAMGELIDVRDTALVTLADGDLVLIPWRVMKEVRFGGFRGFPQKGVDLGAGHRAIVRRVSRFPQGMSPEIEARFLAELGRPALRVFDR
jgi:hypothetical protein